MTENVTRLETQENEEELENKLEELYNSYVNIVDGEEKNKLTKKEIILRLAHTYHQQHDRGIYILPLRSIGGTIMENLSRKGINEERNLPEYQYVYQVLKKEAPEYLTETILKESANPEVTLADENVKKSKDVVVLNKIMKQELERFIKTDPRIINNDNLQEFTPKLDDKTADIIDEAKKRDLNILKDTSYLPEYQSEDLDPFKNKIETDKPEYRKTVLSEALKEYSQSLIEKAKLIETVAENVNRFPFDLNIKEEREFEEELTNLVRSEAQLVRLEHQIWKPMTDMKYKREFTAWFDIDKSDQDYGVHAASSKNPGEGWYRNPETQEVIKVKRNLTKEHIDDKLPFIRNYKILIKSVLPLAARFEKWYVHKMKNWTIGESHKLGPKLSDRKYK